MNRGYGEGTPVVTVYGRGPSFSLQTPGEFMKNAERGLCRSVLVSYPFGPELRFGESVPGEARTFFRNAVAGRPRANVFSVAKSKIQGHYEVEVIERGQPARMLTLTKGELLSEARNYFMHGFEALFKDGVNILVRTGVKSALGYAK